jgi:hypothetical protein
MYLPQARLALVVPTCMHMQLMQHLKAPSWVDDGEHDIDEKQAHAHPQAPPDLDWLNMPADAQLSVYVHHGRLGRRGHSCWHKREAAVCAQGTP